jgi:hypothetical protein
VKDYVTGHGIVYEQPSSTGRLRLPVLPYLIGQYWDELALCLVHSLRPSCIRVVMGCETTDSWGGRVTVRIDPIGKIESIDQECDVGLGDKFEHGHALYIEMCKRGILK